MDIIEDGDFILQKSSARLLSEFKTLLPHFLRRTIRGPGGATEHRLRRTVKDTAVHRMVKLLEPFQEWPQLLDPQLESLLVPLTQAFLECIEARKRLDYTYDGNQETPMSLLRGICKVLYTLCKVRSPNVISRLFSNEPRHLEPMLDACKSYYQSSDRANSARAPGMSWEEKYIFQIWLSHLALAPFDLATVGGSQRLESEASSEGLPLPSTLPSLAVRLISLAVANLGAAGKEREAAVFLLVRVVLRPDVRKHGALDVAARWALDGLVAECGIDKDASIYRIVSLLAFLAGVYKSADPEVARPLLLPAFRQLKRFEDEDTQRAKDLRNSALGRKAIIKVYRALSVAAIQSDLASSPQDIKVAEYVLDDVMGHFLESLRDSDTPVRFAASKAISAVASRLGAAMTADVSEAVLESLKEDVLWAQGQSATVRLHASEGRPVDKPKQRSLVAVNGLRWHGLVLALSQLLYRRAPPVGQLPSVINALLLALSFEKRSSAGISTGANVRDAACFGVWALARKYTTAELRGVNTALIEGVPSRTIVELLAIHLMKAAACDMAGNIRRGASAALQELIGRHPDTVTEGIRLVQVVDYHAVARRSRALEQVAVEAARLDLQYWESLVNELLSWRGVDGASADSRRAASRALGLLAQIHGSAGISVICVALDQSFRVLDKRDVERRHGLYLAAAAVTRAFIGGTDNLSASVVHGFGFTTMERGQAVASKLFGFWALLGEVSISHDEVTSKVLRADLTVEAVCTLVPALTALCADERLEERRPPLPVTKYCEGLLQLCLAHRTKSTLEIAAIAAKEMFSLLEPRAQWPVLRAWLEKASRGRANGTESAGFLRALGLIYPLCRSENRQHTLKLIVDDALGHPSIEGRIGALQGLKELLGQGVMDQAILEAISRCLNDYTMDQRGDIGSLVRLEAVHAVHVAMKSECLTDAGCRSLASTVCILAAEKLDKCRLQAWACFVELLEYAGMNMSPTADHSQFSDLNAVSSAAYYKRLLALSFANGLQQSAVVGIVSSIGAGSESVMVSSRTTMSDFLESSANATRALVVNELEAVFRKHHGDDRVLIPCLETLAFVLDLLPLEEVGDRLIPFFKIFLGVQKAHYKTGSIPKLTAAVNVYAALFAVKSIEKDVWKRLVGMLRHPYPSVRNHVADVLYTRTQSMSLCEANWSVSPRELRGRIDDLTKE